MDLPTSYGTRLLSPFSWRWHAIDLMPIVDIYLLIVLAAGLLVGWRSAGLRRRLALAALAFLVVDYGVRAATHHRALGEAARLMAPILPAPCADAVRPSLIDTWPIETPTTPRDRAVHRCLVEIAAIPTFLSPFRWQVVARLSDSYQTLDLDLMDARLSDPAAVNGPLALWRAAARSFGSMDAGGPARREQPGRPGVPGIFEIPGRKLRAERRQHRDGQLDRHALCRLAGAGPKAAFGAVHGHGDGRSGWTGDRRTARTVGVLARGARSWSASLRRGFARRSLSFSVLRSTYHVRRFRVIRAIHTRTSNDERTNAERRTQNRERRTST